MWKHGNYKQTKRHTNKKKKGKRNKASKFTGGTKIGGFGGENTYLTPNAMRGSHRP